jgi:hypothetical protein
MRITGLICRVTPDDWTGPEVVSITDLGLAILENMQQDESEYSWIVRISAEPRWVADGLEFTRERVEDMLLSQFGWISGSDLRGWVLVAPSAKRIRAEQGYSDHDWKRIEGIPGHLAGSVFEQCQRCHRLKVPGTSDRCPGK